MVDYDKMTVAQLRKTVAYKKIPRDMRKSQMRKSELIKTLKKYDSSEKSTTKTTKQIREECKKKGLVYDIYTKKCRESKRGKKSKSPSKKYKGKTCMNRSNVELAPHQVKVVKYLQRHRGVIAVHGLGTGKTLTAIASSQCFLDKNPTKKVIVISPASLIENFKKGMDQFGDIEHIDRYFFYSFEKFLRMGRISSLCRDNMLIVDEAHNLRTEIKQTKGKKTKKVLSCSKTAKKVLLLTATPIVNSLLDLVPLLAMVTGVEYQKVAEMVNSAIKSEDIYELRKIAKCIVSVYGKGEDNPNYPRRIDKSIYLTMKGEFLKKYIKLEKLEIPDDVAKPTIFYAGFRTRLLDLEDSQKIEFAVKESINLASKGEKSVIYSNFANKGIKNVVEKINSMSDRPAIGVIAGGVSLKNRKRLVEEYNKGTIKILLITKAGGEGLDLKNTAAMFILDPPWNEASLEQAIGRAIRYKSHESLPPSKRKVVVYTIYNVKPNEGEPDVKPSVDMVLKTFIDKKKEMTKETMEFLKSISIENEENKC